MSEIADQVRQIAEVWKRVYEKAAPSPSLWQPHWPNGQLIVLDEMVRTLEFWTARVRAPTGFSPGFQLAKMLVAPVLPSLQASVSQLDSGQYNYLPTFVGQVQDALSKIHSMVVYSDKGHIEGTMADQSAQLVQALALMGTAQRELAQKAEELRTTDSLAQEILAIRAAVEESSGLMEELLKSARSADSEIKASLTSAKEQVGAVAGHVQAASEAETRLDENETALATSTQVLHGLLEKAKDQSKVIDSILPKAASAGLAAAFSTRGRELNWTRNFWAGMFAVALILLTGLAFYVFTHPPAETGDFWQRFALRLTLAAPLVWLGWVSAIQYGNVIRVQEDYAFKEATSKAFQGYRDHIQHLQAIDTEGSRTASQLLAESTITILAQDPLRIYGATDQDASPAHSLMRAAIEKLKGKPADK